MPVFSLDSQYLDAESLANAIDDVFGQTADDKYQREFQKEYESELGMEKDPAFSLTDSEAIVQCTELKTKYNVIIGVSWGDLPFDLQQKWVAYSCDYHLGAAPSSGAEEFEFIDDVK
jgi:hypothetical protein